jgi:uncharacterized protein Veg
MKNLAQFKKRISENVGQPINLTNFFHPERSRKSKIIHSQSNSFAIQTQNEAKKESTNIYDHSWVEFGKSARWSFEENTAVSLDVNGKKAFQIEF